jgi:hypothetical protein
MTIVCVARRSVHSLIAGLALSACATVTRVEPDEGPGGAVAVLIHNNGEADAAIYECHRDDCSRVTTMGSGETMVVEIPAAAVHGGDMRLAVRRDGESNQFMTQPLDVRHGDRPVLSIESVLSRSSLTIEQSA